MIRVKWWLTVALLAGVLCFRPEACLAQSDSYARLAGRLKPIMAEQEKQLRDGNPRVTAKMAAKITANRLGHIKEILTSIDVGIMTPEFAKVVEESLFQKYSTLDYGMDYDHAGQLEKKYVLDSARKIIASLTPGRGDEILQLMKTMPAKNAAYKREMIPFLVRLVSSNKVVEIEMDIAGNNLVPRVWGGVRNADLDSVNIQSEVLSGVDSRIVQLALTKYLIEASEDIADMTTGATRNLFSLAYIPGSELFRMNDIAAYKAKVEAQFKEKFKSDNGLKIKNSDLWFLTRYVFSFCDDGTLKEWNSSRGKGRKGALVGFAIEPRLWEAELAEYQRQGGA